MILLQLITFTVHKGQAMRFESRFHRKSLRYVLASEWAITADGFSDNFRSLHS